MCDKTIIQNKVDEFVANGEGFTSVDIANAIKRDGTWAPNREVAAFLRRWTVPVGYGVTRASVALADGSQTTAALYLPGTMSASEYTSTSQEAITPDQFEQLHGYNPVGTSGPDVGSGGGTTTVSGAAADAADAAADTDDGNAVVAQLKAIFKFPKAS